MPECFVKKSGKNTLEVEEAAEKYLRRFRLGEDFLISLKRPRNLAFHRKFMALLRYAFENQERYEDFEAFRKEVTMRAGWWEEHVHVTGQISYTAKSIAFAKMDELQFDELYRKAITAIIEHFLVGMDPEELDAAVEEVLGFA